MQIKVWSNFSKRKNSTKQPTGGTTVNVVLKDQCSILSPVFILNTLDFTINYVEAFGYYYFADVTNLDGNRSEISCEIDYLASFKSQIAATTAYVDYCASSPASNLYIDDPRNQPTAVVKTNKIDSAIGWTASSAGSYILGMANCVSTGSCGAPTYYAMSGLEISNAMAELFNPSIVTVIEHEFNGVFNSIVSCIWLPFNLSFVSTAANVVTGAAVFAGSQALGTVTANKMITRKWHDRVYCSIPNSLGYDGTYIQTGKYITATIYLPGVGVCPLNYDIFKDSATGVTVDVYLDLLTGDVVYYLSTSGPTDPDGQSTSFAGNVAAKVPITGASYDGIGVAAGILSTAGAFASGNPFGTVNGLMNIFNSLKVDTMVLGANSSPLALIHNPNISIETHTQVPIHGATSASELEVFRNTQGMPYFDSVTLSSLSGYIHCVNASVDLPGDGAEQDAVNSYLNSGFYLE